MNIYDNYGLLLYIICGYVCFKHISKIEFYDFLKKFCKGGTSLLFYLFFR